MTPETQQKTKKILGIVGNVVIWIFVAFSVLVTVLVFAAQGSKDGVPELFGKSLITIESPSMTPTYKVGDLVFMEKLSGPEMKELEAGDIITYRAPIDINGDGKIGDLNTHRILTADHEKAEFTTIGDNNNGIPDAYTISYNDIIGKCTEDGKIGGIGNVINFLRSSLGFFLCVVLPMFLFFVYEVYNFIVLLMSRRKKPEPVISKETEEEIKRKAIEEYLLSQGMAVPPAPSQEPTEEEKTPPDNE